MSTDVMSRIEQLPEELREHIYSYYVKTKRVDKELKHEIEFARLQNAFRNVIGILGVRNASWGFLYRVMTRTTNESIYCLYVHYEPLVMKIWRKMSFEERDQLKTVYFINRAFYTDDGRLEVEFSSVIS